jgi:hypothetical protein
VASRYHWITNTIGQPNFTGSTTFANLDLVIPAGGQLKKFIIHRHLFFGTSSGPNLNYAQTITLFRTVNIISGAYSPRELFVRHDRLHCDYPTLFDSTLAFNNRIYTTLLAACDDDLFVDQKCTYGKTSGASFTIRLACTLSCHGASPTLFSGSATYVFKALYYL